MLGSENGGLVRCHGAAPSNDQVTISFRHLVLHAASSGARLALKVGDSTASRQSRRRCGCLFPLLTNSTLFDLFSLFCGGPLFNVLAIMCSHCTGSMTCAFFNWR